MSHPYEAFERTPLWKTLDAALAELEHNQDVALTTTRQHVIGYLCQQLAARRVAEKSALLPEEV